MMKCIFGLALIQCCLVLPICSAADTPPTDASIKQLFEVTHARSLLDTMMTEMDGLMKKAMAQATQGQQPTPDVQKEIDQVEAEVKTEIKSALDWNKLEPMYIRIYQKSFNQSEIDGMIAFYKTATGQAVLNKMPLVLQNTMAEVQQMLQPMIQHLQQKQHEIAAKVQAKKSGS